MDPHIDPEQPGLPVSPGNDDNGASYRLRLNESGADRATGDPSASDAGILAAAMATLGLKERRQSPRLRCSGSVEFRAEGSDVHMWGTLTDISLHGCYLEMSNTYPVDTKVDLVLKSCGLRIQTPGKVRASYPALGMGICFTGIDPQQQLQLKRLLAELTGHVSISVPKPAHENPERVEQTLKNALESADPKAFLDEIIGFFQRNHLLSRDEFHGIAKRVRRA